MNTQIEVIKKYFAGHNTCNTKAVVDLFADNAEVFNVNFPPVRGKEGVKSFCENLYARTSSRSFEVLEIAEGIDVIMVEWRAKITFRIGAKVGPWELVEPFEVELRGINKFEFMKSSHLIRCLRIYHETSTVVQLAQTHSKKS